MSAPEKPAVLFREDQQFRDPILWVILVVFAAVTLGTALYIVRHPVDPAADTGDNRLLLLCVFGILPVTLVLLAFAVAKLQIEVSSLGLFVRFFPLHWKVRKVDLAGVVRVEAIAYHAVRDYGGFGIRLLPRAKAYSVGGGQGVRILYQNGYHLLLGTRHPEELQLAINRVMPTLPPDAAPGSSAPPRTSH